MESGKTGMEQQVVGLGNFAQTAHWLEHQQSTPQIVDAEHRQCRKAENAEQAIGFQTFARKHVLQSFASMRERRGVPPRTKNQQQQPSVGTCGQLYMIVVTRITSKIARGL